jgi:D-alanine-D-alanine ligase
MFKKEFYPVHEKLKNKKIGVLMGGLSEEREISIRSGENVYKSLRELNLNAEKIHIGENTLRTITESGIDIAYNILHGKYGEDGRIQGLLEMAGIPYTGEGVLESACAFNKLKTKEILTANNIFTPDYMKVPNNFAFLMENFHYNLNFPVIYKPEESGSSFGIEIIENAEDLKKRFDKDIESIKEGRERFFLESYVRGTEVTVGAFEFGGSVNVLPILEIKPKNKFYDYEAKYTKGMTDFICPAEIPKQVERNLAEINKKIYKIFNFRGCVRTDFIIDSNNIAYALEINTQPGMTDTSDIPQMAQKAGYTFAEILLVNLAKCVK